MIDELNNNIYDDNNNFYPCKYAEYNKELGEWKVGTVVKNSNDEYTFSTKDYKGSMNAISLDFAIKLLEVYKAGGKKSVKSWLSRSE